MKTIEEKAKAYDEAMNKLRTMRDAWNNLETDYSPKDVVHDIEYYFPELKESGDEKIRKRIIERLKSMEVGSPTEIGEEVAWLEKQSEQTSAKVEPRFRIGDTMRTLQEAANGVTDGLPVVISIDNGCYRCNNETIDIKDQDNYEYPPMNKRQKPAEKVEPKFKIEEGKRYVCISQFCNCIEGRVYKAVSDSRIIDDLGTEYDIHSDAYKYFRLWTIEDAKDGDLIYVCTEEKGIQAIFHEYKNKTIFFHCYLCSDFAQGGYMPIGNVELAYPLQETHYKRFFEKMHEAGCEWDAEKKELKKIEQRSADIPKCEDYGIDGLYNAIRILEKTLGKVDGYQTDDGILEHECAIRAVKSLYEQKPAEFGNNRSKELSLSLQIQAYLNTASDELYAKGKPLYSEERIKDIHKCMLMWQKLHNVYFYQKSWSEEDEKYLRDTTSAIFSADYYTCEDKQKIENWLKALKDRYAWKPSDEQVMVLAKASETYCGIDKGVLYSLYNDLKKLK